MTLPLLAAQSKEKFELFVRDGACVGWEVDAPHEVSDTRLGIMGDAWSFRLSFTIRHGVYL